MCDNLWGSPLVTIGVPLYNHADFVGDCLASIIAQTYGNIEIIVVDDGSADNSYSAACEILGRQTSRPYLIRSRPNKGLCNTLNEICSQAKGKYICFVGSDDQFHPEKTARQVAYLEAHPEVALVHSNSWLINQEGRLIGEVDYTKKRNSGDLFESILLGRGGINTPTALFRRSVFDVIGMYDPQFAIEDTDFWLRLTKNYPVGFVDEKLTYYRRHGDNLSSKDLSDTLVRIFEKNVMDKKLLRKAVYRIYYKRGLRALRKGDVRTAIKWLRMRGLSGSSKA